MRDDFDIFDITEHVRADLNAAKDRMRRDLNQQLYADGVGSSYTTTVTRVPRWTIRLARVRGYVSHLWSALLGRECECPYDHDGY